MEWHGVTEICGNQKRFWESITVNPGQVTENWLTGFGQGKFCVLAAMPASSLEKIKGWQVTVSIVSEGLLLLKKKWKLWFDSLVPSEKIIEVGKLDARITQINVTWNGRDYKP